VGAQPFGSIPPAQAGISERNTAVPVSKIHALPHCPFNPIPIEDKDVFTNLRHTLKEVVTEMNNPTTKKGEKNVFCLNCSDSIDSIYQRDDNL
jgi:hypothetical protein